MNTADGAPKPNESLEDIASRLASLSDLYEDNARTDGERGEAMDGISDILKSSGRQLIEDFSISDGLYPAERTSENIAFVALPNDKYMEVSIGGNFNVSFTRILGAAATEERKSKLAKLLDEFK